MLIDVDGILFDSDGVLIDSLADAEAAWRQLAVEYGLDSDRVLAEMHGVRAADTLSRHVAADEIEQAVARIEALELELAGGSRPIRGAIELTAALPSGAWSIVTSATRPLAIARWSAAGITLPDRTVTADDVERGKPDPQPYERGAAAIGTSPARCVVFEDAESGADAARRAGAQVVAVGHAPWRREPLARVGDLSSVRVVTTQPTLSIEFDPI